MAEGKALGQDDLFESDAFQNATKGAKELLAVIKETQDTIKGSLTAQKEFVRTFKAKSYDDVKRLNNAIAETNTLIKQKEQLTKDELAIHQQSKSLNQEKLKTQREEIKNTQLIEKQNRATEKSLNALNGEYSKAVKKLSEVKKQLKELEFTGRTNGKLFKALSTEFTGLNKSVRGAEERVGEFQRNVGNYASGFSPLSNSINQLTREMPAFANSVQTGFMAISNNIPAFFDAISGIKKANEELRAQGEPTKSVLSQLGSAFFSWGTALSVGVTLLTVYGKEFVEFIGKLIKGTDTLAASNEALAATYAKSADLIRKNTEALLDLMIAQGKMTNAEKDAFLIENDLLKERKLRDVELLKQRTELAKKFDLELNREGQVIKKRRTEIQYSYRESADMMIQANKAYNRDRIKQEESFAKAEKGLIDAANQDKLNMEKTAAYKIETLKIEEAKKGQKKAKDTSVKDAREKKKEFDDYWKQYLHDLEIINKDIEEADIQMLASKRDRELAENQREYERRKKELEDTKIDSEQKNEALLKLLEEYNQKRKEINEKYLKEEDDTEAKVYKKRHDAFQKLWKQYEKDSKDATDKEKKQMQELIKEMDKLEKAIEQRYANKNKVVNDYLDKETEANKKAIDTQERLAERGLQNTLAFEKEKAAKLELEKRRQQEKELKQQKIFAFYQLFSSYAKNDPNTALQKAIVDTAIAEVVSGSFIKGTENVERDLKGNKVHNGQDGYVVAVDGKERIFNPKQNAMIGDISNDEAAKILQDYQRGILMNYGGITTPVGSAIISPKIELTETNNLLRLIASKPVSQTNLDNLGNVIHTEIRNGVANVTRHKRRI